MRLLFQCRVAPFSHERVPAPSHGGITTESRMDEMPVPKFWLCVSFSFDLFSVGCENSAVEFPPCFPKIHTNVVFPSTSGSSEWSLPFRFSDQNFVCIYQLSQACYIPSHVILFKLITLIIFSEAYKLRSSCHFLCFRSKCSLTSQIAQNHCSFFYTVLGPCEFSAFYDATHKS